MVLNDFVKHRLSDGGVVNLAVSVPAKSDDIHHYIAGEAIPVLDRDSRHAHQSAWVFRIHMKDRNRQPLGQIRSKRRAVQLL